MTTVLLRAKDKGSMHRLKYLDDSINLHDFIRKNISIEWSNNSTITYMDICGSFCDANIVVDYFTKALHRELEKFKTNKTLYDSTKLNYPIATLNNYELHLERNFFGVRQKNSSENLQEAIKLEETSAVTVIRHVEVKKTYALK